MHRAAYLALGLDWTYEAIEVDASGLTAFVDSRDESWAGLSLTMPLKVAVLDLLDDSDELVSLTRSCNTLVFEAGRRIGHNTDVYGIAAALRERASTELAVAVSGAVIGAGATARSALAALAQLDIRQIVVVARSPAASDDLARLARLARLLEVQLEVLPWDRGSEALGADVLISTVPAGVVDPFAAALPRAPGTLLDVVYSPWPTALAEAWLAVGGTVVGGLSMLAWQAAEQVRLMTGCDAPVELMRRAGEAAAR